MFGELSGTVGEEMKPIIWAWMLGVGKNGPNLGVELFGDGGGF